MTSTDNIWTERACGERVKGGIYVVVGLGPGGRPVEDFLVDPPLVVDVQALGIGPQGMAMRQDKRGIWHLYDRVGADSYPFPAGYVEETRRGGVSRRVPGTLPLERLTLESKLFLVHERAGITTPELMQGDRPQYAAVAPSLSEHLAQPWCPQSRMGHGAMQVACAGLLWEDHDLAHRSVLPVGDPELDARAVTVALGKVSYAGASSVPGVLRTHAIFMALPAYRFQAVAGDGKHEERLARMKQAHLLVEEVSE